MKLILGFLPVLVGFLSIGVAAVFGAPPSVAWAIALLVAMLAVLVVTWIESSYDDDAGETRFDDGATSAPPPAVKHGQMILAAYCSLFDGCHHFAKALNVLAMEDFLSWPETAASLTLAQRAVLEGNGDFRQLLPYVVVRQRGYDGVMRYLAYQRTSQVGEQRLAGKVSIGFGGHIDATSVRFRQDSTLDLPRTLIESALRELSEELVGVDRRGDESPLMLGEGVRRPVYANMFITSNIGVGRMHLGIVMYLDLPTDLTVTTAESELDCMGFMGVEELRAMQPQMEEWSQLLTDSLAAIQPYREVLHHPV